MRRSPNNFLLIKLESREFTVLHSHKSLVEPDNNVALENVGLENVDLNSGDLSNVNLENVALNNVWN